MNQEEVFGQAQWVCAGAYSGKSASTPDAGGVPHFPILRGTFQAHGVKKATLRVLGLGFFHCYLNGREVSADQFLPLSTDYEPRPNYPLDECVTGHRIYVPEYDVTGLMEEGKNVLALHFGGGWYTFDDARYGDPKAIYRLSLETCEGVTEVFSSVNDRIGDSYVKTYYFTKFENQDFTDFDSAALGKEFDDSGWPNAVSAKPLDTNYLFSDCPADRVEETREVTCISEAPEGKTYDTGRNCASYPVLKLHAAKGEKVTVLFSEERKPDGTIHPSFSYEQSVSFVSDGTGRVVQPMFTWFAYRYFQVLGNAEPLYVKVVHTDVKVNSSFESDNETLNWLYLAYLNTQLSNMHTGIPSDCPHIERRGYTGDGQLTCHAAMSVLDARAFYRKWVEDIGDCQDVYTGHVQYTAPYTRCGGGPGGWGCAIVEVPYQYYRHYGDMEPMSRLYPQMLRYFDYLEAHSENLLVTSDKKGEWCLGDWCAPGVVALPAPFVNNYFYIKSMNRAVEIARLTGRDSDVPMLEERIRARKDVLMAAYFNTWDGNFIGSFQGANAFAVDIGIGDERTYQNLVAYYDKLGRFDTGIFGTEIVSRVLFEHGDGDLAVKLLTAQHTTSFEGMRRAGSTTIWEYWPDEKDDRSHDHPMFGAVIAHLFDYLLGIQGDPGYQNITVSPKFVKQLNRVSGSRTVPGGTVAVAYVKDGDSAEVTVTVSEGVQAVFCCNDTVRTLHAGENHLNVKL